MSPLPKHKYKFFLEPRIDVASRLKDKYAITEHDKGRLARKLHLARFSPNKFGVAMKRLESLHRVEGPSTPREHHRDRAVVYVMCATATEFLDGSAHTARGSEFAVVLQELWFARFRMAVNDWSEGGSGVDYISAKLAEEVACSPT